MDLLNNFINIVAPPTALFGFLFFSPPYFFFKFLASVYSYVFSESVAGKVVVITGVSSGIGEQLAYQYAKKGACLVLVARREISLREVAGRAREYGSPDVLVIRADVSKMENCKRFVEETVNHFGRVDHLVNNAGILSVCKFEDSTDINNFRPIMDTNFWGAIYPTYFAIPHLRNTKGRVVVTASVGGWLPVPKMSYYNASKAALINFYEVLRVELGPEIGITIVTPGYIESEMTQGKYLSKEGEMKVDQDLIDAQVGAIPVAYAEKCAKAIVDGACQGNRYVTTPFWYNVLVFLKVLCPELLEWGFRMMLDPKSGKPLSKMILDITGAQNVLYPESIRTGEIKTE